MRGTPLKLVMLVAVGVASVAAVVSSAGAKGGPTLVFAAARDPKTLDPALVSDGESLRPIRQMMEGLVTLKPGTTVVRPSLALSWSVTKNRLAWTFKLRRGVKFQDGTQFNAAAVCFNFNRWFNFKGPFQSPDATYYWQTVYGGFHHPEAGSPQGGSLYKGCKALKNGDARIFLNNPSGSFIGSLAIPSFSMQSPTALQRYQADEGTVSGGVFRATGTYGTLHPTGTGPFVFQSWTLRDKLVLIRNTKYWGPKAKLQTLIFRPISDNAARLQALQTGEVQGYDLVAPEDVPTVSSNPKLKLLNRPAFNVGYVGFNQKIAPMNNPAVRQAVAYGLDREGVVKAFYGGRGQVADEFMPPQVIGYAKDVQKYTYDPAKAKDILTKAGFKLPVELDFWYPTSVSRPYMPDPQRNFEAFAASLEKSGFKITPHSAPWSPDYLGKVQSGQAQLYLLGWTGDYGDPDNFVGTFFRTAQDQWGFNNPGLFDLLNKAREETSLAKRIAMYQDANRQIMKFLPGVPYVHSTPALAFQKRVKGYIPSPVSLEPFQLVSIVGGT